MATTDFARARRTMIDCQIRPNRVTDPTLLAAFEVVPRELFLPAPLRSIAYADEDIHLGNDRYLMEPMVLARLLQAAEIEAGGVVLDIGCASGYGAAVLSRLASTVVALECDPALARHAERAMAQLSIDNVAILEGPLEQGCAKQGPFDAILLEGSIERLPDALLEQLAEDGRLVAVRLTDRVGRATLWRRLHGATSSRVLFDAAVRPLPGFSADRGFVF